MKKLFITSCLLLSFVWASAQTQITPSVTTSSSKTNIKAYYQINLNDARNRSYLLPQQELGRWITEGALRKKITPYYYVPPNQKYTARVMEPKAFAQKMKYYDSGVGSWIEINPADITLIELTLHIETNQQRNMLKENIERISIFHFNYIQEKFEPIATFRYSQVRKHLRKLFKKSIRQRYFEALKACWYPALAQRQLMGMHEALEQHLYAGNLMDNTVNQGELKVAPKSTYAQVYGEHLPTFNPDTTLGLNPSFIPVGKHKLRTTLWQEIDLKHPKNQMLNSDKYSLSSAIVQGIRAGKIPIYYYSDEPFIRRKARKMQLTDFERHMSQGEGTKKQTINPHKLSLIGLQSFYTRNTRKKKVKHDVKSLTLILPQYATIENSLGDMKVAVVSYKQAIRYLKRLQRQQPTHYAWVAHFVAQKFESSLTRFSHPENDGLKNVLSKKFPVLSLKQIEQKASKLSLEMSRWLKLK